MPSDLTAPVITIPAAPVKHLVAGDTPTLASFDAIMQSAWNNAASLFSALNTENVALLSWTDVMPGLLSLSGLYVPSIENVSMISIKVTGTAHRANGFVDVEGFDPPTLLTSPRTKIVYNATPYLSPSNVFEAIRIRFPQDATGSPSSQNLIFTDRALYEGIGAGVVSSEPFILPGGYAVFRWVDTKYVSKAGVNFAGQWQLVHIYSPHPEQTVSTAASGGDQVYAVNAADRFVNITGHVLVTDTFTVELPTTANQLWEGRKIRFRFSFVDDFSSTSPAIVKVKSGASTLIQIENHFPAEELENVTVCCVYTDAQWVVESTHWRKGTNNNLQPGRGDN